MARSLFCSLDARSLRSLIFGQVVQHVQPLGVIRPSQRVAFGEDVLRKPDKMFLVIVKYGFVNLEVVPPTDILSIVVDAFLRHLSRLCRSFLQGNRIKKTRKINDLGITRVLAYVYI